MHKLIIEEKSPDFPLAVDTVLYFTLACVNYSTFPAVLVQPRTTYYLIGSDRLMATPSTPNNTKNLHAKEAIQSSTDMRCGSLFVEFLGQKFDCFITGNNSFKDLVFIPLMNILNSLLHIWNRNSSATRHFLTPGSRSQVNNSVISDHESMNTLQYPSQ